MRRQPILWSIAGLDTAGGAGLSADQRAADAMGVHLCPIAAALTAQNSQGVQAVFPVDGTQLDAQLGALAGDLPPMAIKTGLLGSVLAVQTVARWVDRLRATVPAGRDPHRHLALIVDPVLGASAGGQGFADEAIVTAYRDELLPRATVITPNRAEALRLLDRAAHEPRHDGPRQDIPELARALRALGAQSVVITGGDAPAGPARHVLDWLDAPHAQGWLTAPRVDTRHTHGTGCTFATGVASAWALGHVAADAIVLAKMLTHHALSQGHMAGHGAGPVKARPGFAAGPALGGAPLPWLGLGTALPWRLEAGEEATQTDPGQTTGQPVFLPYTAPADGLYGIVATSAMIESALGAGLRCLQLRHKAREGLAPHLREAIAASARAGAALFINDHWRDTLALPPPASTTPGYQLGLHLGQEDLLAMADDDRRDLLAARGRVMLGLSSHSLWELARAAGCGASYIACGPVQATTTKDMPWVPQGEDNLRWWAAHSPVPVVAIGGLLEPDDLARFAAQGPAALCVVRGLGQSASDMAQAASRFAQAVRQGRHTAQASSLTPPWPHPVL